MSFKDSWRQNSRALVGLIFKLENSIFFIQIYLFKTGPNSILARGSLKQIRRKNTDELLADIVVEWY